MKTLKREACRRESAQANTNRAIVIVTNSCWEVSIMYARCSSESAHSSDKSIVV
jgi:hypothetical protein